jgi:hypothetical protein
VYIVYGPDPCEIGRARSSSTAADVAAIERVTDERDVGNESF